MALYLRKQLPIAGIIYIGHVLIGVSSGWSAPIIPKLQNPEESPLDDTITDATAFWIGSMTVIGCIVGPHISGYFSNIIGRKLCLLSGGIITAICYVLLLFPRNLAMILAVRVFKGLGIGVIFVGNIVYLGEIATTSIRGFLLTGTGVALSLGMLVMYAVGPYVSYAGTAWLGTGLSLIYICAVLYIPESPIFQMIKGNEDEARRILTDLGRDDEIEQVLATKVEKDENGNSAAFKELITVKCNRKALIILVVLGIFQHMSGIMAMTFFTTTIFDFAGSSVPPQIATIIIGITQLASSCLSPLFIERSGRKTFLLLSTVVCCISLSVLGAYLFMYEHGYSIADRIGWLPLVALIFYFLFYSFGLGIIPVTLTGEMFRSNVRSAGSAVTATAGWLAGFGVSSSFGYMLVLGSYFIFWMFAAACACACVFTVLFVPETKGKSLIEIQEMLDK